jgi:hypothetical protein
MIESVDQFPREAFSVSFVSFAYAKQDLAGGESGWLARRTNELSLITH